jgi:NifB/MoaA-like Fe-S oxidoreductase
VSKTQEQKPTAGLITAVLPGSAAHLIGVRPGDALLSINDQPCEDVIDVQYYGADEELELVVRRDGQQITLRGRRAYNQPLGLEFAHPTFDIDIRRCNNLCSFCFVLQMAPRMRRTLYIKDDDYRYSFLFGHFVTLTNLSEHDWRRIIEQHLWSCAGNAWATRKRRTSWPNCANWPNTILRFTPSWSSRRA